MCGIVGFLSDGNEEEKKSQILNRLILSIKHRGPDAKGMWSDGAVGIYLGHCRLSIVDLSSRGQQPMSSPSGRFIIVYNGEIYNYKELRSELPGPFKGESDTEVLLHAIEEWGLITAIKRFVGMFAFALWDRQQQNLYLVRDRLGIKPLYWGWIDSTFVFGSELKALRSFPGFHNSIDRKALTLYLRHNCIPAPFSIYENIFKLLPGTILTLNTATKKIHTEVYWSPVSVAEMNSKDPFVGTEQEAIDQLHELLLSAVKYRMISDVPLGAFLSGGIDSSTVVALMQAQSEKPIKTFSIGSSIPGYNEAEHAKIVAGHLGTEHTELYVTPEQAMAVIAKLPTLFDEPFSDSSQIPTLLVSHLARKSVTVALSGDGGDEIFAGYNRHLMVPKIQRRIGWLPPWARKRLANSFLVFSPDRWNIIFDQINRLLPANRQIRRAGDNIQKFADILALKTPEAMYEALCSHWKMPGEIVQGGIEPETAISNYVGQVLFADITHKMMLLDMVSYLPDDILTKIDRASMAFGLEARVPLLDHRVVEFAWQLPLAMKIRNNQGKWILRQVLYKYIPREMVDRPKMGFGVPIDSWLRGPLLDWAEELLDERRLTSEGYFNPSPIRKMWGEHLAKKKNWQYHLWDILMFQSWLEREKAFG